MTPEEYIANPTPENQLKFYIAGMCDADFRNQDPVISCWAGSERTTIEYMLIQNERLNLSASVIKGANSNDNDTWR